MKPKIKKQSKNKNASKMGCKGPFDARFEAYESSQRALSDQRVQKPQKRNFSKIGCFVFLPTKLKKNQKVKNVKKMRIDQIFKELKIVPARF